MPKTTLPEWNLDDLYSSITDPKITTDLAYFDVKSIAFKTSYADAIKKSVTAATLKKILREYSAIIQGLRKLEAYAYLEHSTHTGIEAYGAFFQHITTKTTATASRLLFVQTSLTRLSDTALKSLSANPSLKEYSHYLTKKLHEKPHTLSEQAEALIQQKALTGKGAFVRLQQQELANKTAPLQKKQKHIGELMSLLYSPKRTVRKQASLALHKIGNETLSRSSFTYNNLMQDYAIDSNLRSFKHPEDMRHLENEVAASAVDTLQHVVTDAYPLVHAYYTYKRKVLKLSKLYEYDRYAPIPSHHTTYSFQEATQMILTAFASFAPEFHEIARQFFDNGWIHAAPSKYKQAGAYCMYCTPDSHPYILVNYHASLRDVFTLAHELGHGIHAYLAQEQNVLNYDWPLTIAETASIFGEMILFRHLLTTMSNTGAIRALIMGKLEEIIATVFRQTAMYQFERKAHELRATQGELTSKQIGELWMQEQRTMFGTSVTITPAESTYWSLIPHIFQTPFYVYSYAFGELLTLSLFSIYEKNPNDTVKKYLAFLKAGGSKSPQELLSVFGMNMNKRSFWEQGVQEIETLIAKLP
jgi:oligoendopeptidase F